MVYLQNVSFHFAGDYLFETISYRIQRGDRIGLIGRNGAGKSTMLKLLALTLKPSEGQIAYEGEVSVGFLRQDINLQKGCTVWQEAEKAFGRIKKIEAQLENVNRMLAERTNYESATYQKLIEQLAHHTEQYNLLGGYTMAEEIEKVLIGLGFRKKDFLLLTEIFSSGWRMRIELAKLLLQRNDLLLLDEPTNHLDIDSILWLEDFLRNYSGAVVLVSHDKQFLDQVTNRTIEIAHQSIQDYKCNLSKFLNLSEIRRDKLLQSKKNQEKQIKHIEQLIERFRYKPSKASFAQSLIKRLEKLDRIEAEEKDVRQMNIRFVPSITPGKVVLEIVDVSKKFAEKTVFLEVSFSVARAEKIAFVGQNGQGKSTLAKIIVGQLPHQGTIRLGHNVQLGYFAQDQSEFLVAENTVLEEAEDISTEETHKKVRDLLGAFLFNGDEVYKKVKMLSGGERNRLALCKLLLQPFNVLIMDEPTNHLDMRSKKILKDALKNYEGTLIIVSHDRDFLQGLVDKMYEFRHGRVKAFLGGIDEYLESRKVQGFRQIERTDPSVVYSKLSSKHPIRSRQKKANQFKKKIANLEYEIQALEKSIASIEQDFIGGQPYQETLRTYELQKKQLDEKMIQWEKFEQEWEKS
ncbi:MAG: ribosomal protection-like ABC-F family protein [Flavobacteriales bacterium AspAUS03]